MNYSDEYQTVWLTPIRTAARVSRTLMENFNFVYEGHTLKIPKGKEEYHLLFNIRNPYPRMVSVFMLFCFHKKDFNKEFEAFLNLYKTLETPYQLSLDKSVNDLNSENIQFIRTEFLHKDLMSIEKLKDKFLEMGKDYENIVLENRYSKEFEDKIGHNRKPWQSFYNQKIADKVLSLTENQFDLFNYNKDYWKDGTP